VSDADDSGSDTDPASPSNAPAGPPPAGAAPDAPSAHLRPADAATPAAAPGAASPERTQVLVLGAGMAGLAAAHQLLADDVAVLVLEARDRLGGRTRTDRHFAGFPLELGAEFIHGERAAMWPWVERLKLRTLQWPKRDESWVRMADGRRITMREARASEAGFGVTRTWDLAPAPAGPGEDFAHYLRRVGFDATQLGYVARGLGTSAGAALHAMDAASVLEGMTAGELDGEGEFRILEGFGAIVEALGLGLEIVLRQEVRTVSVAPGGVRVETAGGGVFEADRAVIALPLGVLLGGGVRFDPPLPDAKRRALAGLRAGPAVKLLYRFPAPVTPPEVMAIYAAGTPALWWTPSAGHGEGSCVWTALATGEAAEALSGQGPAAALARGLATLRAELGDARLDPEDARMCDWGADPYALGGYSHVLPGCRGARGALAAATPPLYWAGEATAPEPRAATVHGALLSGLRAADEILDDLLDAAAPRSAGGTLETTRTA